MMYAHAPEAVVDRVADLLLQRIGLRPDATLRGRISRAVGDDMREHGGDPTTYLESLGVSGDVLQGLLNRVTVQETAFFRHPEQFEALTRDVLPTLPQPVTIWSAGCANGQEAFSLAMLLEEQAIDGSVIATDVSTAALRRTEAARYDSRELSGLSSHRIAIHGARTADQWQINPAIRSRVKTLQHNLLDPLPADVRSCQVVLCRNVLIYLSPEHSRAFLERVADTLPQTLVLVLGAAETIWQVSDRFKAIPTGDAFIHRRVVARPASLGTRGGLLTAPSSAPGRTLGQAALSRVTRSGRERTGVKPTLPGRGAAQARAAQESATPVELLTKIGQDAVAAEDFAAAVIVFRKCAYLKPHDPVAQLHLGLALEAAGDELSAQRAYAAARHALLNTDPTHSIDGTEGYATAELGSLLDSKQRRVTK